MVDKYLVLRSDRLEPQHETLVKQLEALTEIRNTIIKDQQALCRVDSSRQALSKAIDILSAKMIALKPALDAWRRESESRTDQAGRS